MTTLTKKLKQEQQGKLLTSAKGVADRYDKIADTNNDRKLSAIWHLGMDPIAFYDCCLGTDEQESDYLSPLQRVKRMSELSKGKMQEAAQRDAKEEQEALEQSQQKGDHLEVGRQEEQLAQDLGSVPVAASAKPASLQLAPSVPVQFSNQMLVQAPAQASVQSGAAVPNQVLGQVTPPEQNANHAVGSWLSFTQGWSMSQATEDNAANTLHLAPSAVPTAPSLSPVQAGTTLPASQPNMSVPHQGQALVQPVVPNQVAAPAPAQAPTPDSAQAPIQAPAQIPTQGPSPFKASGKPKVERLVIEPLFSTNNPYEKSDQLLVLPALPQHVSLNDFDKKDWFINREIKDTFGDELPEEEWDEAWVPESERLQDAIFDIVYTKPLEYGNASLDPEYATYFFQHALATYIPENRDDMDAMVFFLQNRTEKFDPSFEKDCGICDFMWQTPAYPSAKVLKDFASDVAVYPLRYLECEEYLNGELCDGAIYHRVFDEMVRSINFSLSLEPLKKFAPKAKEICEFFMKSSFGWLFDRQFRFWLYESEVMRYFEFAPTVVNIYEKFRANGIEPRDAPTVDYILSKLLLRWAYFPLPFIEIPDYRILLDAVFRSVCNAGYLVRKQVVGPLGPTEYLGGDEYWDLIVDDINDYFSENRELGDLLYYAVRPDEYSCAFYTELSKAGRAHYEQVTGQPAPGKLFAFKRTEEEERRKLLIKLYGVADFQDENLLDKSTPAQAASDSKPAQNKSQTPAPQAPAYQIPVSHTLVSQTLGAQMQQLQNSSVPSAFDQNNSTRQPDFVQKQPVDQSQIATPLYEHAGINTSDPSGFGLENFNVKLSRPVYDQLISEMSANLSHGNALDPNEDDITVSAMDNLSNQGYSQHPMQNHGGFNGQNINPNRMLNQPAGYNNWLAQPQNGSYNQPMASQQYPSRPMQGLMGNQGYGQPRPQQNYNQQRQVNPQSFGQNQRPYYPNQRQQVYNQAPRNNQYAGQGQMRPQGTYSQGQNGMGRNMGGMNVQYPAQGSPMRGYNNQMQGQGQGQMRLRPQQQGPNNWGNQNYQGYNQGQQGYNQGQPNYNHAPQGNGSGSQIYANSGTQVYNNQGQQSYNQVQPNYNRSPQGNGSGSQAYVNSGTQVYTNQDQQGYNNYPQVGSNYFQNSHQSNFGYRNGQPQSQQSWFAQTPQSFSSGSQGFNNEPQQFNQGQFGQGNGQLRPQQPQFNQDPQNFSNGPQGFNRNQQNFSNSQNGLRYGQPQPQYNQNQGNYRSGQPQGAFTQGQNGFGSRQPQPMYYNGPQGNGNWQQYQPQPQVQPQVQPQSQLQAGVNQGQGAFTQHSGMGTPANSMGTSPNYALAQQGMSQSQAAPTLTVPPASSMVASFQIAPAQVSPDQSGVTVVPAVAAPAAYQPQLASAHQEIESQKSNESIDEITVRDLKKFRKTFSFDTALIELYKHAQRMGIPFEKQQSMRSMLSLLLETMFLKKIVVPELPPFELLFSNVSMSVKRSGRVPALKTKPLLKGDLDEPRYGLPFELELQNLLERFKLNQVEFFKCKFFNEAKEAMPLYQEQINHLLSKSEKYRSWLEERHGHFKNGLNLHQMPQELNVIDEEYDSSAAYLANKDRKIKRSRKEQIKYDYYTRIAQLEDAYSSFYVDSLPNELAIKEYATFRVRLAMREDLLLVFPDDEDLYDLEFLGVEHDLKFMRQSGIYNDQVQADEARLAQAAQAKAARIAAREEARAQAARDAAEADYQAEMKAKLLRQLAVAGVETAGDKLPAPLPTVLPDMEQTVVSGAMSGMESPAAAEPRITDIKVQSGTKLLDASLEPALASDPLMIHSGSKLSDNMITMHVPVSLPSSATQTFAKMSQASLGVAGVEISDSQATGEVIRAKVTSGAGVEATAVSGAKVIAETAPAASATALAAASPVKATKAASAKSKRVEAAVAPAQIEPEIESIQAEIVEPSQLKRTQSSDVPQNRRELVASSESSGSSIYADTLRNFKNRIKYPHFGLDFSSLAGAVRGSRLAVTMQGVEIEFHVQPEERFEYDLGLQYATTLPDPRILLMDELKRLSDAKSPRNSNSGSSRRDQDNRDYVHPVIAFLKANVLNGGDLSGGISTHAINAAIAIVNGAGVKSEIQIAKIVEAELKAHNIEPIDQTSLLEDSEKWAKYAQIDLDGEVEDKEQIQKVRDLMQVLMQPSLPAPTIGNNVADSADSPSQAYNQGLAKGTGQSDLTEDDWRNAHPSMQRQAPTQSPMQNDASHLSCLGAAQFSSQKLQEVVIGWCKQRDPRLDVLASDTYDPFGLADRPLAEQIMMGDSVKPKKMQRRRELEVVSDDEDMIIMGPSTDWRMNEPEGYRRSKVNIYKTFDNFVPSPENQTVLDTAKRIVAAPDSQIYSPFYVYSASGLGKTHLIMAIANALHDMHPNKRVTYIRAEDFIYNYVLTVKQRNSRDNRRYQDTDVFSSTLYTEILESDVVIVDDVQNFAKAQKSRDAFFEVVAAFLENPSHQLILASDVHPNELKKQGFNPRLTSRFAAGICYELVMPNVSSRRTIICAKSSEIGIKFSETLIDYMASHLGTNIREIEGAVKSVSSHILINGFVSLNGAVRLVGSYIPVPREGKDKSIIPSAQIRNPHLSLAEVKRLVARAFSLSISDLESSSRRKALSTARAMAMLLAKELLHKVTLCEIGKSFNRDHSSVIEAMQRIRVRIDNDVDLKRLYDFLTDKLTNPSEDDGLNLKSSSDKGQASTSEEQDAGTDAVAASNEEA